MTEVVSWFDGSDPSENGWVFQPSGARVSREEILSAESWDDLRSVPREIAERAALDGYLPSELDVFLAGVAP